jgi:hypothetical protein
MSVRRSCAGFRVEGPDGPLGVVGRVGEGSTLELAEAGGTVVRIDDVALVDTGGGRLVVRAARPAATRRRRPLPRVQPGGCDCTCPTDFGCAVCGYGVAAGHLPHDCPMCGSHAWRPIGAHGALRRPGPSFGVL